MAKKRGQKSQITTNLDSTGHSRLQLFILVIPIIGFFPALWMLYQKEGNTTSQSISRLAIVLGLCWVFGSVLLGWEVQMSETGAIPLLIGSSILTTSYFIISFGLMIQIWQRKPIWLPGLSWLAEKLLRKHLS
ncbi:MAG: hypothetical protein ACRC2J_13410 [Microcoleaceae cyanobacterium]